jgi:hypothetical protein
MGNANAPTTLVPLALPLQFLSRAADEGSKGAVRTAPETTETRESAMTYTDAYLFDVATTRIEAGESTVQTADHLVRTCGISDDRATRIVSVAFDPSQGMRSVAIYISGRMEYEGFDSYDEAERFIRNTLDIGPADSVEIR